MESNASIKLLFSIAMQGPVYPEEVMLLRGVLTPFRIVNVMMAEALGKPPPPHAPRQETRFGNREFPHVASLYKFFCCLNLIRRQTPVSGARSAHNLVATPLRLCGASCIKNMLPLNTFQAAIIIFRIFY